MNITFDLHGNFCNEYPFLIIQHNHDVLYEGHVEGHRVFEFEIDVVGSSVIFLTGIQKCHGINAKWDTRLDDQGLIIEDKYLAINNIVIQNVSMGPEWINNLCIHRDDGGIESCNGGMYSNGYIKFEIKEPVLSWVIEEKFIKQEKKIDFEFHARSGQRRFEYDYIQEKIRSIRQKINDQNSDL